MFDLDRFIDDRHAAVADDTSLFAQANA